LNGFEPRHPPHLTSSNRFVRRGATDSARQSRPVEDIIGFFLSRTSDVAHCACNSIPDWADRIPPDVSATPVQSHEPLGLL